MEYCERKKLSDPSLVGAYSQFSSRIPFDGFDLPHQSCTAHLAAVLSDRNPNNHGN